MRRFEILKNYQYVTDTQSEQVLLENAANRLVPPRVATNLQFIEKIKAVCTVKQGVCI